MQRAYLLWSIPRIRGLCQGRALQVRYATTAAAKKEGDISSVFASLSGQEAKPLPARFAELKGRLIQGHEDDLRTSWERLLGDLREEAGLIEATGPKILPEISFNDISSASEQWKNEVRKRGAAVVRNVVPEEDALRYKADARQYIRDNPHTKAFPPHNPQVYELYWSPSQVRARAHPNLLQTQCFLMNLWHSKDPSAMISNSHPTVYADRLRIRGPGDTGFALGPHVDGGSVERWEEGGYGRGQVYERIWQGKWEEYDPWESSCRLPVVSDLYNGAGACSMFRMFQGWLSMSTTGPGEGTLLVNPLLGRSTAYYLMRPFFSPRDTTMSPDSARYLHPDNWKLDTSVTERNSMLHGATMSQAQELKEALHPHLELSKTMIHVPEVRPGDYVVWHCDTIHAVDKVHKGKSDSSVMYIPVCPLTETNIEYLIRQRQAFINGTPGPDFPGGIGEAKHIGRPNLDFLINEIGDNNALAGMGFGGWHVLPPSSEDGLEKEIGGEERMVRRANDLLLLSGGASVEQ